MVPQLTSLQHAQAPRPTHDGVVWRSAVVVDIGQKKKQGTTMMKIQILSRLDETRAKQDPSPTRLLEMRCVLVGLHSKKGNGLMQ